MENIDEVIRAKEYTLDEILGNKKYTVDYFQREYKWETTHIEQLISDLVGAFMDNFREGDQTTAAAKYSPYYMGSIVVSDKKNGTSSIIDGQQRITSLTLLLIFLYHATNKSMGEQLSHLIYSDSYGKKSFNIQVPEREACLKSLYDNGNYTPTDTDDESTKNMVARYEDICNCFPLDEFNEKEGSLQSFIYWIKGSLIMVKISALSDDNAYTIFETMNDRGMPLTSSDMLKGFILSKFTRDDIRQSVNNQWKKDMFVLSDFDNNAESLFFQSWLRSQYAQSIRASKAGSVNQDFENIGTRFHNWFKDNYDKDLLAKAINGNIEKFVNTTYRFFFNQFVKIKNAEKTFNKILPHIYYNNHWGIAPSLSYPLYLAPLVETDSDEICNKKIELVARFLDNFVVRRATNYRLFSANSQRYTMCNLVKCIRGNNLDELKNNLLANTEDIADFNEILPRFRMHGQNKNFIKYFLARLTSYIEEQSGMGNNIVKYLKNPDCKPYEIEHIWSDHYEWFTAIFSQKTDFDDCRNTIGDLILLPNGVNQSLNDLPAKDKLPHYIKENLLARSLCEGTYQNNPSFIQFFTQKGFPFKFYTDFTKEDIQERCKLYAAIAAKIWDKLLE
ncbi:MAG: DUF262 domain-containing protein [Bacteroidales bacterium]|nr:DUF262 domain-containing protein [Bacteroidales bacterium]